MRKSLIAVRKAAATVLFALGVGLVGVLVAPAASAAPVQAVSQAGPMSFGQLPEWGPCDFGRCRPNPRPPSNCGNGGGCNQQFVNAQWRPCRDGAAPWDNVFSWPTPYGDVWVRNDFPGRPLRVIDLGWGNMLIQWV